VSRLDKTEVTRRILAARPEMSAEAVLRLIEAKKRELGPLLTDEGAAYLVAEDLSVGLFEQPAPRLGSSIRDLVPGLKDVSVAGRILVLHAPQGFLREDGSQGRALRLILGDDTGLTRVVLWNSKVDEFQAKGLAEGQGVRLRHGYTREDPDGGLELHAGEKAAIEPLEDSTATGLFPRQKALMVKIRDLGPVESQVWMEALVAQAEPPSVFRKENGEGRVRRLVLQDETSRVGLVLWNKEIDELGPIEAGGRVSVIYGVLRPGPGHEPEIHLGRWGKVTVLSRATAPRARIADLDELRTSAFVEAVVVAVAPLREFTLPDGTPGRALSLLLADGSGMVRVTLWDEAVEDGLGLRGSNLVEFRPVSVTRRFGDLEVQIRERGALSRLTSPSGGPITWAERAISIRELGGRQGYVTVEGGIGAAPSARRVTTARGKDTQVASFFLEDGSKTVRVSLWDALAEKALGLAAGSHVRLRHLRVVRGRDGQPELSSSVFSSIEALAEREA